ncbi:ABC transporter substrate-binding protein [Cohnella herbarum]|uniref:ABC transporter substrate-binding protein n=1 Tax=Cohnella herbarum TaxID=2728023 RepID=A0A7Z2ZNW1_9BACL|nr:ABC transporter substrate-binding protein [Cohnella herbarum]QJD86678.1 ABC transporter substrate-binding protein [Cohnella herbarum]
MKKVKKPLLQVVSAVLLLATVLAGCSSSNNGNNGAASPESSDAASPTASASAESSNASPESQAWVFGSEPFEFSAFTNYSWQDFPSKMEDNPFWKYLKENKQVTITPILAKGNNNQLMTTMISGGNLPDLIYGDRFSPDVSRLYEAGKLVAFDDYLDKYPNLKKYLDSKYIDMLRMPDGKLYQFPNWYTDHSTSTAGYVVNKKIYAELGSPKLETMDDLYAYLVQVKNKYPDVIPFEPDRTQDAQGIGLLYTGFKEGALYQSLGSQIMATVTGDKLTSIFADPAFHESQKFVSKLYREKLISQDMFTQDRGQVLEKLMAGRVAVYAGSSVTTYAAQGHAELTKTDPDAGYFMIWPIVKSGLDKNKVFTGGYDKLGWNVTVITTAAEDPEKIFAFLDYNTSPEGMAVQFFGPEGGNWQGFDENGYPNFTDTYNAAEVAEIQTKNDPVNIAGNSVYIDPAKNKYEDTIPPEKKNWQARWQKEITWPTANDITEFRTNLQPPADSELGDIRQSVLDLLTQTLSESATAKSDEEVDKILDKADASAMQLGYQKLLDWRTEQWQANRKTLGIE